MWLLSGKLSKSDAGYGKSAETGTGNARSLKIFLLFPLPVKATTRRDKKHRPKKHPGGFFENNARTRAPAAPAPPNQDPSGV
jgi:hypothetical protein